MITEKLNELADGYRFYEARREEFETDKNLNFRISPTPFGLEESENERIVELGQEVLQFMKATDELYRTNQEVAELLNTGKPDSFLTQQAPNYLFYRPDLIVTEQGLRICEIETSPFGLGLSHLLNTAYSQADFETLAPETALKEYVQGRVKPSGQIVYTDKTKAYAGQLRYTADKIFSANPVDWSALHIDQLQRQNNPEIDPEMYRAFYLSEYLSDPKVRDLLNARLDSNNLTPANTPHLEEKAILALIWDKRFEPFYKEQLGEATFRKLRECIPKTWIVGQEEYFSEGMPRDVFSTLDLANLSRNNRQFVIKPSGFSHNSSWAEGVNLLHEKSTARATEILTNASSTKNHLYIVQEFYRGQKRNMKYFDPMGELTHMRAKLRVTPYYSTTDGRLLTAKVTGCENTDFIHTSSNSGNTALLAN